MSTDINSPLGIGTDAQKMAFVKGIIDKIAADPNNYVVTDPKDIQLCATMCNDLAASLQRKDYMLQVFQDFRRHSTSAIIRIDQERLALEQAIEEFDYERAVETQNQARQSGVQETSDSE